mmetsp:Transcript_5081/g.9499  ORF Transcript_5081/g.9499 Transcript_5081/m.9499 type:complete len:114 (-) Transcript_5081:14-355(-)
MGHPEGKLTVNVSATVYCWVDSAVLVASSARATPGAAVKNPVARNAALRRLDSPAAVAGITVKVTPMRRAATKAVMITTALQRLPRRRTAGDAILASSMVTDNRPNTKMKKAA